MILESFAIAENFSNYVTYIFSFAEINIFVKISIFEESDVFQ